MKKKNFLTTLLILNVCLLGFQMHASTPRILTYDFNQKKFTTDEVLKYNSEYQVKIININTLLFDIALTSNKTIYTNKLNTDLLDILKGFVNFDVIKIPTKENPDPKGGDRIFRTIRSNYKIGEYINQYNFSSADPKIKEYIKLIKDAILKIGKYVEEIQGLNTPVIGSTTKKDLDKILKDELGLQKTLDNILNKYLDINEEKIKFGSTSEEDLQSIVHLHSLYQSLNFEKKFSELKSFARSFDPNYHFYSSPIIKVQSDDIKINIKISPKKDSKLPHSKEEIERTFKVKGTKKVGASLGIFMSSLHDDVISIESNGNNLSTASTEGKTSTGIAGFLHYTWKVAHNFGIGFNNGIGVGVDTKPDYHLFIGGSIVLGIKNNLYFNAGISFARVNRLKDEFHNVEFQNTLGESDISRTKIREGIYGSFSYFIRF